MKYQKGTIVYSYDANTLAKNQKVLNNKGHTLKQASFNSDANDQGEQPKQFQKKQDDYFYQIIVKQINNPYAIGDSQVGQSQIRNKNNEIEEDMNDRAKQSNQLYTSDDDCQRATQSLGVDESVDSLILEEYDYYEEV